MTTQELFDEADTVYGAVDTILERDGFERMGPAVGLHKRIRKLNGAIHSASLTDGDRDRLVASVKTTTRRVLVELFNLSDADLAAVGVA